MWLACGLRVAGALPEVHFGPPLNCGAQLGSFVRGLQSMGAQSHVWGACMAARWTTQATRIGLWVAESDAQTKGWLGRSFVPQYHTHRTHSRSHSRERRTRLACARIIESHSMRAPAPTRHVPFGLPLFRLSGQTIGRPASNGQQWAPCGGVVRAAGANLQLAGRKCKMGTKKAVASQASTHKGRQSRAGRQEEGPKRAQKES